MIKLRGHHLICLHFFQGEGYSKRFIVNLKGIIKNLERGNQLKGVKAKVVEGTDVVCEYCPHLKRNLCAYEPGAEQKIQSLDSLALKLLEIKKGDAVFWEKIKTRLPKILPKWQEFACLDCDWKKVCLPKVKSERYKWRN